MNLLKTLSSRASRIHSLPGVNLLSPARNIEPSEVEKRGFLKAQNLAYTAAKEISSLVQEGWTEEQTARLLEVYLRDHGVQNFFHRAFVWFGEHTRFNHVKKYKDFQSGQRRIKEGEPIILDVAPIYEGYTCDIGYSTCFGKNTEFDGAQKFLNDLKAEIPKLFESNDKGSDIWKAVDRIIIEAGFDNIHSLYPMSVLGHRVHQATEGLGFINYLNFEWSSYWNLLSRGVFGQVLAPFYEGDLVGLWAIEPHIGAKGFGAKFEEILVVSTNGSHWLSQENL